MFHRLFPSPRSISLMLVIFLMLVIISPAYAWDPDAEYDAQWGLAMINVDEAYRLNLTGAGITIGIIDTGINPHHLEFSTRAISGYDFLYNSLLLTDPEGHGSHVAGIIGAARDGIGMHGVAFDSSLVSARVIEANNSNDPTTEAINYLLDHTTSSILNNSWGVETSVTEVTREQILADDKTRLQVEAFQRAVDNNKLVVFSAGNESNSQVDIAAGLPYFFPDLQPSWIAVVAVDSNKQIADYSNRAGVAKEWTIAAPGGGDNEPVDGIYSVQSAGGYVKWSGTSMAAPHVSGAAALLWQAFPNFTAAQIAQLILISAADLGDPGVDEVYGWGLLDLDAALKLPNSSADKTFDLPDNLTLTVPLSGTGGLIKNGNSVLILAGTNTYTGATNVNDGTLIINGTITSPVNVAPDGILGGSGLINSSVNLSGTLSPGNSPGTLTVTGNLNQGDGSTYLAELGGTNPNQHDRTIVGGQYTIGTGVTLDVDLYGSYQPIVGDTYRIVITNGGVTGNYNSITRPAALSSYLRHDVVYGNKDIWLCTTPSDYSNPQSLGWTWDKNQASIAQIWQDNRPAAAAALTADQTFYNIIFPLDANGLKSAATEMSGQLLADSQAGALDQLRTINQTLGEMVHKGEEARVFANYLDIRDGDVAGRRVQGAGVIANYDLGKEKDFHWGLGVGYSQSRINNHSGAGSSKVANYDLHLYSHYQPKDWYLQGQIGFGQTIQRHERHLSSVSGQANAWGKANGNHLFSRLAYGKGKETASAKQDFYGALLFEQVTREQLSEHGDDCFTISSSSARDQRFASEIGFISKRNRNAKPGQPDSLTTRIAWVHEFSGRDNNIDITWRNQTRNVSSEKIGADALQLGLNWDWNLNKDCQAQVSTQVEQRSNSSQYNISASLNYHW